LWDTDENEDATFDQHRKSKMSHWDSPANSPLEDDEPTASGYGLKLFAIYTSIYTAFVLVSAFRPTWMAQTIAGVNLAVLSGFGLIVGAIVLAAIYLYLCRPASRRS
jgi:hypothetical protein